MNRRIVAIASVLALLIPIALVLLFSKDSNDFSQGSAGPEVSVVINSGDFGSAIAKTLASQGVVKSTTAFISLITKDSRGGAIAPGAHFVHTHIPASQALDELLDPKRNRGSLTITEGSTLSDIRKALAIKTITQEKKVVAKPYLSNKFASLEGQLFPATYSFAPGTTSNAALTAMVDKFHDVAVQTELIKGYQKYSPYEVLTIASMVQIEGDPSDYAKVSRVIYNRLKIGMPLQLNSTVQYAANLRGRIALSRNATKLQSPYNTYIHTGLPPTPISNPGEAAIKASLHPVEGNWLYFITVKPHDTRFTNDFALFQEWVTMYNNNLANGAFK